MGITWTAVRTPPWWRDIPVGYRTDLPVLVITMACWLLLPVYVAHLVTGLALIVLTAHHLRTRLGRVRRVLRLRRRAGVRPFAHRLVSWLLLVSALAMTVSGLLRWAGVPPEYAQHAASSYAMLTMVVIHMIVLARPLRARLRTRPAARHSSTPSAGEVGAGGPQRGER